MEGELISVIVPIYNVKEYLPRCVESITNQTYRNLEIILVDDGSTDGTSEIVDTMIETDHRIRKMHKPNGGSSSARNEGIKEAKGKYLAFVDADDYIEPYMIEKLYMASKAYHLPIAQGGRREINEEGEILPDICVTPKQNTVYSPEEFMKELLLHKGDCSFCTKLTDASLFENLTFPEGVLNEDFHVLVQMLPKIEGIISIKHVVYNVFYRMNSNTRKNSPREFSRVYADNVDNADFVKEIVDREYPALADTAVRFGLYQRLDYLLHVPISQMNAENKMYKQILQYIRKHKTDIQTTPDLTEKDKKHLRLLSTAPKLVRVLHLLTMKLRGKA